MKALLKLMLIIASLFAVTFVIVKSTGVLSVTQIENWFATAKTLSPIYVVIAVITLLFIDLFIAVPTLTIMLLAGYFLGFTLGATSALIGVWLAGLTGYLLSQRYGNKLLSTLLKDEIQRQQAIDSFKRYGFSMILLSRASPILPEVTACLSGMTGMSFKRFSLAWLISSTPYALIATYAGSISTLENPKPAIITAITLTTLFWFAWLLFHRYTKRVKTINT